MSQIERGGTNLGRWPAEFPETDNPAGSVGEEYREMTDEERTESGRLEQLPTHEHDAARGATSDVGADVMSAGGTATDTGATTSGDEQAGDEDDGSGIDSETGGPPPLSQPGHL